jgi:hypothetical protein
VFEMAVTATRPNLVPPVFFDQLDGIPDFHLVSSILRSHQLFLKIHNLFDLHQKPADNLREVENLLDVEAGAEGVAFWQKCIHWVSDKSRDGGQP